ncbi:aminotransferase class I/II-fold pyridoxal phosphate-dependent enzyme [Bacillus velezensis]|nr:aminotransferase class I/II-fold pyridoxal phosphate-dependent enzyme [Bacillus velezensis]
MGTLSKAIGVLGGYAAGSQVLIDYLRHKGRPFLFSTSHPPAVTAACIEAIDVLLEEPEHMEKLWENTAYFKDKLVQMGLTLTKAKHRSCRY